MLNHGAILLDQEIIFNTVGHNCSGETLVEGLVELGSGYDVTQTRLKFNHTCMHCSFKSKHSCIYLYM